MKWTEKITDAWVIFELSLIQHIELFLEWFDKWKSTFHSLWSHFTTFHSSESKFSLFYIKRVRKKVIKEQGNPRAWFSEEPKEVHHTWYRTILDSSFLQPIREFKRKKIFSEPSKSSRNYEEPKGSLLNQKWFCILFGCTVRVLLRGQLYNHLCVCIRARGTFFFYAWTVRKR